MDYAPEPETELAKAFTVNRSTLLAFARRCGANDEADDVIQDVWLRVRTIDFPVGNALSYLYRVTYTVALDHQRGKSRTRARDQRWYEFRAPARRGASDAPGPDRVLLAREKLARVEAKLESLGEPTVTIFRRHRLQGETQSEIAQDMTMGLSTVQKHVRRALRALLDLREVYDEA